MELKEFAKFLQNKSFDEELHKARQKSFERILASESLLEKDEVEESKKVANKKAV